MSTEALVLAVASIARPTAAAVVWALLARERPLRLLTAYLLAGLAFSLATGITLMVLFGDALSPRSPSAFKGALAIVLGVAALLAAVAAWAGWLHTAKPALGGHAGRSMRLSPAAAATAGVLTHLPGVFYLAALSAIATTTAAASAITQVTIYNVVWFTPAIAAVVLCLVGAAPPADRLAGLAAWGREHERAIMACGFGALGVWLLVKGLAIVNN